ncbi:MAG: hypothetical protein ACLU42_03450 [Roseburia faecis]
MAKLSLMPFGAEVI